MINTELKNNLLTITINRPEKKNALTAHMYDMMAVAIEQAAENEARVILIQGRHGCFTSGNDVNDFISHQSTQQVNETYRFMQALLKCSLPVVAKVEGLAIGIGTTLLLHCDFVYCDHQTKFAMPFINLGLVPEYASSFIIPRTAGYLKASELLLLGEIFTADTALSCGIVTAVINAQDLDEKVNEVIAKLRSKPAEALQASKVLIRNQMNGIQKHIDDELVVFAKALNSAPAKEACAAFMQKRPVDKAIYK